MLVTIKVTTEHIQKGVSACRICPVALAVNDILADGYFASAGTYFLALYKDTNSNFPEMISNKDNSMELKNFILNFDNQRDKCKPFQFELDIPEIFLKAGANHGSASLV